MNSLGIKIPAYLRIISNIGIWMIFSYNRPGWAEHSGRGRDSFSPSTRAVTRSVPWTKKYHIGDEMICFWPAKLPKMTMQQNWGHYPQRSRYCSSIYGFPPIFHERVLRHPREKSIFEGIKSELRQMARRTPLIFNDVDGCKVPFTQTLLEEVARGPHGRSFD
jgi:hypothetical protein